MKFEWNDEMQEALGVMCLLAHKHRVDITITFTHDGDVEVKAEPTYWDRDTADTPQADLVEDSDDLVKDLVKDTPQMDYKDGEEYMRGYKQGIEDEINKHHVGR